MNSIVLTLLLAIALAAPAPAHALDAPAPCSATDSSSTVRILWTAVAGADGYEILRNGAVIAGAAASETEYLDHPNHGTYLYCVRALSGGQPGPECCDAGSAADIVPPAPQCTIENDTYTVTFSWRTILEVTEYAVFRDGKYLLAMGPEDTSLVDRPGPGSHRYCVTAVRGVLLSNQCCRNVFPPDVPDPPGPCSASDDAPIGVEIEWRNVSKETGYRIYRDGVQIATVTSTSYIDTPSPGTYEYCVRSYNANGESDPCCDVGTAAAAPLIPAAPPACTATQDSPAGVTLSWTDVGNETSYVIYRDGESVGSVVADATQFLDVPPFGWHEYCVRAKNLAGESAPCCTGGARGSGVASPRLSWETCDPQTSDQTWSGPGSYSLVASVLGLSSPVIGHDTTLEIQPDVPDAWRFDPAGCQTDARIAVGTPAVGACPPLIGANPFVISGYSYDPVSRRARFRAVITFDAIDTAPETRSVLWRLAFDHAASISGTDVNPATCDGASANLRFDLSGTVLLDDGGVIVLTPQPLDDVATWNGRTVPTQRTTLGRIKALYR